MDNNTFIAITIFVFMFIVSGFNKIISGGSDEMIRLGKKIPMLKDYGQMVVLFAGAWELISAFIVIYGSYTDNKKLATYGTYSLILFTLLATTIFYTFPFKYKPALSNLSVISGLYLMMKICF